ncbi:hypothetical protein [Streptomyces sp. cg36]|uniref:hypothetical protein n=1 Tax=Streptomyces sp. cg36 TaxID=3238798 RepID=UPI0034E21F4E
MTDTVTLNSTNIAALARNSTCFDITQCGVCGDDFGVHERLVIEFHPDDTFMVVDCDRHQN